MSSPVVLQIPGGPITASIFTAIDGADLMRIHIANVAVISMPVDLAEDLVDAVIEMQADQAAAVQLL